MAAANLTKEAFNEAVLNALKSLENSEIQSLTQHQSQALYSIVNGGDTFVSLPTGHGKSLIYQLAPLVWKQLGKEAPLVLVISPLNALIDDQIRAVSKLGIKASKLDASSLQDVDGLVANTLIFCSPEILESGGARKFLYEIEGRLVAVVIDESHCIVNWGLEDSSGSAFRSAYAKVGHVRAFTSAPFLCLTATASVSVRKKILKVAHMRNVKIVKLYPEKSNIKYCVKKVGGDVEETFSELITDLKEKRENMAKTVVYCQFIKDCGELFSLFDEEVDDESSTLFAMYHSKTPHEIQQSVLTQFLTKESKIRIVFATSALGMGVNIPDIRRVFHYGVPGDMEQYVQEVGRGGRDGNAATAVLLYVSYHLVHCDNTMRQYVKGNECRRTSICVYFKEKAKTILPKHVCCDVCECTCDCQDCKTRKEQHAVVDAHDQSNLCKRTVSEEERELLEDTLNILQVEYKQSSVLGSGSLTALNDALMKDLLCQCEYIFTVDYLMENFPIFDKCLAQEIITVFNDVFGDITEYKICASMLGDLQIAGAEDIYTNVPDWCMQPNNDSESEPSEDEVENT